MSSNWDNGNNEGWDPDEAGTYSGNHGFDMLAIYTDQSNIKYGGDTYIGGLGWQNILNKLCYKYVS